MDIVVPFLLFVLLMSGTPGPANSLAMIGGAVLGYKRCLPFILAVVTGSFILNILIGLGLGVFIQKRQPQDIIVSLVKRSIIWQPVVHYGVGF